MVTDYGLRISDESRNPKEARRIEWPNLETTGPVSVIRNSDFGLPLCFDIRVSDFNLRD